MTEWYHDFVNTSYTPKPNELLCLYRLEPAGGFRMEDAAGRVASESSVGTWTELTTMNQRIRRLMAKAYEIQGNFVKVAYPPSLFENGNMAQVLSSIAGNIFGMKAVQNVRLEDIRWPRNLLKSFHGPQLGLAGIRKILRIRDRPLTATVPKPKVGLTAKEHARAGYEAWIGGIDLMKDDENLTSQPFNKFKERVNECFRLRNRAEKETGERKSYLINITAETNEMVRRAEMVANAGGEYVMVDILTCGWAALQTLREECESLKLAIHAHRAFHAAFTRNRLHGMSMLAVSDVARLIGVDQLHIGTVIGKLESPQEEVLALRENLQRRTINISPTSLGQDWDRIKSVLPTCSGGLHPGLVPELMKLVGADIIIQAGGGVWGHPDGGKAGAAALRQAIDVAMTGNTLEEYARDHKELQRAIDTWGVATFK
ncbi:MAG: type III ribulose-bisphosphate carboxylase [Candidatus Bathyarchaeia archaeon]